MNAITPDVTAKNEDKQPPASTGLRRGWWLGVIVCLFVLGVGGVAWAALIPSKTVYPDNLPEFFYDSQSASHTLAYRQNGTLIDQSYPSYDRYSDVLKKYTNISDCAFSDDAPLYINWSGYKNQLDIDLCLFYVVDYLYSTHLLDDWMRYYGFSDHYSYSSNNFGYYPLPSDVNNCDLLVDVFLNYQDSYQYGFTQHNHIDRIQTIWCGDTLLHVQFIEELQ